MSLIWPKPKTDASRKRSKEKRVATRTVGAIGAFVDVINRSCGMDAFGKPYLAPKHARKLGVRLQNGRYYRHALLQQPSRAGRLSARGFLFVMARIQSENIHVRFQSGIYPSKTSRWFHLDDTQDMERVYAAFGALWGAAAGGVGDEIDREQLRQFNKNPILGLKLLFQRMD